MKLTSLFFLAVMSVVVSSGCGGDNPPGKPGIAATPPPLPPTAPLPPQPTASPRPSASPAPTAAPLPTPTPVQGIDLSGRYQFDNFACIDQNGAQAAIADISGRNSGFTDVITIQGNDFSETTDVEYCTRTRTGRIVFEPNGTFTLNSFESVPLGNCSNPGVLTVTTSSGTRRSSIDFVFVDGPFNTTGNYATNIEGRVLAMTSILPPISLPGLTCAARFIY